MPPSDMACLRVLCPATFASRLFNTTHAKHRIDRARDPTQTSTRTPSRSSAHRRCAMARNVKTEPPAPRRPRPAGSSNSSALRQRRWSRQEKQHTTSSKFAGATEALADVVFDVGRDSQSKWTNAHHELEEHALRAQVFDNPLTMAQSASKGSGPVQGEDPAHARFRQHQAVQGGRRHRQDRH